MVVGIDDIIIASVVSATAATVLKDPIKDFLSAAFPVSDLPMRTLLTAASNNLISIEDLELTDEFRKLDEDTKSALRIIVKASQDRLKEVTLSKSAVELGKTTEKSISETDKEYYDPLFKKIEKLWKELDDIDNDNANMEQKIFEEIAKVDIATLKSEITKLYKELAVATAAPIV